MKSQILKNEVFPVILRHIEQRKASLVPMKAGKFSRTGIEGWFKVEIVAALANTEHAVDKLRNKGPDLVLKDGTEIELKAATDFNINGLRTETKKLSKQTFLLFMANGLDKNRIKKLDDFEDIELLCHECFSDGENEWIVGLTRPRMQSPKP